MAIQAPSLFQVSATRSRAEALLPPDEELVVHDWMTLIPGLKQAIQADLASAWFMYGVLVILVAFSVLNTQLMSVLERTKEFGIVMSLGLTPRRLSRLVLLETTLMGLIGLVLGVLLGGVLVYWLGIHGFTYPGMEEMASKFNLPDRIYPELSAVGLLLGPLVVRLAHPDFNKATTRVRIAPGPNRAANVRDSLKARGIKVPHAATDPALTGGQVVVERMWDPLCAGSLL